MSDNDKNTEKNKIKDRPNTRFYIDVVNNEMTVGFDTYGKSVTGEDLLLNLSIGIHMLCKEIADQAGISTKSVWEDIRTIIDITGEYMTEVLDEEPPTDITDISIPPEDLN